MHNARAHLTMYSCSTAKHTGSRELRSRTRAASGDHENYGTPRMHSMLAQSAPAIYSRRMAGVREDTLLGEIVHTIVEHLHPERVILFGSRARGDHHEDSDYDVIVVLDAAMT